jgi:hypothetical protein
VHLHLLPLLQLLPMRLARQHLPLLLLLLLLMLLLPQRADEHHELLLLLPRPAGQHLLLQGCPESLKCLSLEVLD